MFGELSILLLFLSFFRSVHGRNGMDVWVNVFNMPFLRADSGPWSRMSRAWPAMSAITASSGSMCPSHQELAWGAVEAIQEKVIVETVRKGIVVWKCWSMCWTDLQMFFVSTVLGERSYDVEQPWAAAVKLHGSRPPPHWTRRGPVKKGIMFGELSDYILCRAMLEYLLNTFSNVFCQTCPRRQDLGSGAGAKLPESRPPAHWTRRGPVNEGIIFGELSILLLLFLPFFRSVHGCVGMDVWVNVFIMPFLSPNSGPWSRMSTAWPIMSAITTSSGSTCPSHQESVWGAVEDIQEKVIEETVRKDIVVWKC